MVALIAGMEGCLSPSSQNLEIQTWYDLDTTRDNLGGSHLLMNDLDSTTAGYEELASPTANGGKGWEPIGFYHPYGATAYTGFAGTFDGQGYEIRDLYINRPDEDRVGLFGETHEAVIRDMGVVNVTVIGKEAVGGLVATNVGTVSNCYCNGKVTGTAAVGGLVGVNWGLASVSNSYSTGNVTGVDGVGSLVGHNTGIVSNSRSAGNVTGNDSVGGLVGWNYMIEDFMGAVSDSYSTGSVTGYSNVGGLVGWNEEGTVSNSFWDTETSGQATSDGGTGKNTTEMQDIDTFTGAGWDITAVDDADDRNHSYIWNIVNNVTYPFLSWQPV